jgi:hypothetical protein
MGYALHLDGNVMPYSRADARWPAVSIVSAGHTGRLAWLARPDAVRQMATRDQRRDRGQEREITDARNGYLVCFSAFPLQPGPVRPTGSLDPLECRILQCQNHPAAESQEPRSPNACASPGIKNGSTRRGFPLVSPRFGVPQFASGTLRNASKCCPAISL